MELKYIVFAVCLLGIVPFAYAVALRNKIAENIVLFIAIFFTCSLLGKINFVSMETYRGTAKGFEITLVDIAALILFLLVLTRSKERALILIPPCSILYLIYFIISWISVVNAEQTVYSYFELWKMAKMYFYYWVMSNYLCSEENIMKVVNMIPIIIIYIFLVVLDQKYRMHLFQTNGPLPHQNSLVMYMMIFGTIMFALLLNGDISKYKIMFLLLIMAMAAVCIVSTLSRAGLMCFALSCTIVMGFSMLNGLDSRKIGVTILIVLGALGILAKSINTIIERFQTAPEQSAQTRIDLAIAAKKMADDKTFGIGLNNWGIKINPPYPYSDHIERKDDEFKEGIVETVYLLVAAETGWANLVVFLFYIGKFYILNLINYFRFKKKSLMFISAGLAGGLFGVYFESTLEWVLKQMNNYYQLMLVYAMISAMTELHRRGKLEQSDEQDAETQEDEIPPAQAAEAYSGV